MSALYVEEVKKYGSPLFLTDGDLSSVKGKSALVDFNLPKIN